MDTHVPDVIAIERVFSNQNANTAMGTAQAGGVIALAAARRGIAVHFHTPSEVKAAVTGSGRADKAQVTHMVTRILALPARPRPADAADALALAICHLWRDGTAALASQPSTRNRRSSVFSRISSTRFFASWGGGPNRSSISAASSWSPRTGEVIVPM